MLLKKPTATMILMILLFVVMAAIGVADAPGDDSRLGRREAGAADCPSLYEVNTLAGSPPAGESAPPSAGIFSAMRLMLPAGVAPDGYPAEGDRWVELLHLSDIGTHTIQTLTQVRDRKGEVERAWATTLAGTPDQPGFQDGNTAQFNHPAGMSVDETGVIYVADFGNHAIRRVYPSGWVETVAGGPDQKLFNYPRSVAFGRLPSAKDPAGDPALMVTDTENDRLGLINLADNTITFLDVAVSRPKSVDWFANFIAVADENRIQLLKVNSDGLTVSTIAEGIKANSVFFDYKRHLYLTTQNSNKIQVIWYNFFSGYSDHAEALGGREESGYQNGCADSAAFAVPLAAVTYFGDLVIADTDNQALRLLSLRADPLSGYRNHCNSARCGPGGVD